MVEIQTAMQANALKGFILKEGVREVFSISITCKDEGLRELIGRRVRNFLDGDEMFQTALLDLERLESLQGSRLDAFLVREGMAETMERARRFILGGAVFRKDRDGRWRVVMNAQALLLPGWWKVLRHGLVRVGEDYVVEKRLSGKGFYTRSGVAPLTAV